VRSYSEALAYLNQFISYERTQPARYSPETLSLDRVEQLLDRLGRPDRQFPSIHIAGTKGKGSTAALIESTLRAAGYRTGLYTSPHLHTFRERMRVDDVNIPPDEFARLVDELEPHVVAVPGLTWFEIVTALAFQQFARSKIDVAVLEVGLGGRFDATNVVTPLVSVITSLSMDHMNLLGSTLEQIAFEKAGIIKRRVPVVSAPQRPEALDVIRRVAHFRAAPLTLVGRDVSFERIAASWEGQEFRFTPHAAKSTRYQAAHSALSPESESTRPAEGPEMKYRLPLLGSHQITNAATAITALRIIQERGLSVGEEAIQAGLAQVQWPGRLEILSREPWLVVDGAHNGDSAQKLAQALRELFGERPWTLIVGISADKDVARIFDALLPIAARVIVTRAHNVRAADVEILASLVADRGQRPMIASNVNEAIDLALKDRSPTIVTGSLFTVADARAAWNERTGFPSIERDE
jgi:dihydrofolate synthase/folylpolyglutamate synthase